MATEPPSRPPPGYTPEEEEQFQSKYGSLLASFGDNKYSDADITGRDDVKFAERLNKWRGIGMTPDTAEESGYDLVIQRPSSNIVGKIGDYVLAPLLNRIFGSETLSKLGAYDETTASIPGPTGLPSEGRKVYTSDPAFSMDPKVKEIMGPAVKRMNQWNRALSRVWTDTLVLPMIENVVFGQDVAYTPMGQVAKEEIRPPEGTGEMLFDYLVAPLIGGLPINMLTFLPARAFALSVLTKPWAAKPLAKLARLSPTLFAGSDETARLLSQGLNLSRMPGGAYDRAAATVADVVTGAAFGGGYAVRDLIEIPGIEGSDESAWKRFGVGAAFGAAAGLSLGAFGNYLAYRKSLKSLKTAFNENGILTDNIVTEVSKRLKAGDIIDGREYLGPGKDGRGYWRHVKSKKSAKSPLGNFDTETDAVRREVMELYVNRQVDAVEQASKVMFEKPFNQLKKDERATLYAGLKQQGLVPDIDAELAQVSQAYQRLAIDKTDPIASIAGINEKNTPEFLKKIEISIWFQMQEHLAAARGAWSRKFRSTTSLINEIKVLESHALHSPDIGDRVQFRARAEALKIAAEGKGVDLERYGISKTMFPETQEGVIEHAIKTVDNLSAEEVQMHLASHRAAAESARIEGRTEDAEKFSQLAAYTEYVFDRKSGFQTIVTKSPEFVSTSLQNVNTHYNRGINAGTRVLVMDADGNQVPMIITQKPKYGGARARSELDPTAAIEEIDVTNRGNVHIIPNVGDGIVLTDMSHGVVLGGFDPDKSTVRVATLLQGKGGVVREFDVEVNEIVFVRHAKRGPVDPEGPRATRSTRDWYNRRLLKNALQAPVGTKWRTVRSTQVEVGGRTKIITAVSKDDGWVVMYDTASGLESEMSMETFRSMAAKDFNINDLREVEVVPGTGGVRYVDEGRATPQQTAIERRLAEFDTEIAKVESYIDTAEKQGLDQDTAELSDALLQMREGRTKVLAAAVAEGSTPPAGGRRVGRFLSGQVPEPGNHIVYINVPAEVDAGVAEAWRTGDMKALFAAATDADGNVSFGLTPNPLKGGMIYGVEIDGTATSTRSNPFKSALGYLRNGKSGEDKLGDIILEATTDFSIEELAREGVVKDLFEVSPNLVHFDRETLMSLKSADAHAFAQKFVNLASWLPDGEKAVLDRVTGTKRAQTSQKAALPEERAKMEIGDQTTSTHVSEEIETATEALRQLESNASQEHGTDMNLLAQVEADEMAQATETVGALLQTMDNELGPRPTLVKEADPNNPAAFTSLIEYRAARADWEARETDLLRALPREQLEPIYALLDKIPITMEGEEPITLLFQNPNNPGKSVEIGMRRSVAPDYAAENARLELIRQIELEKDQVDPLTGATGWAKLQDFLHLVQSGEKQPGRIRGVRMSGSGIAESAAVAPPKMAEGVVLRKVIAGFQTGADQGGLRWAHRRGLETGGVAPAGFRTQAGDNPKLAAKYGVTAHKSRNYGPRTEENVLAADGTIVVGDITSRGSDLTIRKARQHKKPLFTLTNDQLDDPNSVALLRKWLVDNKIEVLNTAGNREKSNPGIGQRLDDILERAAIGDAGAPKQAVRGINISSYESGFGAQLSNFFRGDMEFRGKKYPSSEKAYQAHKVKGQTNDEARKLMIEVITARFKSHPYLIEDIGKRGGREFLDASTHNLVKGGKTLKPNDKWVGADGLFMQALREAYTDVSGDAGGTSPERVIVGGWRPGTETFAKELGSEFGFRVNEADPGVSYLDPDTGKLPSDPLGRRVNPQTDNPVIAAAYSPGSMAEVRAIADEFGVRGPFAVDDETATRGFPAERSGISRDEDLATARQKIQDREYPGHLYGETARSVIIGRNSNTLIAVAEKTGPNPTDMKGSGAWSARAAVRSDKNKKTYIYDPYEGQWYDYSKGKWDKIEVGDVKLEGKDIAITGSEFLNPEDAQPVKFNPEILSHDTGTREYGGVYSGTETHGGQVRQPHPRIKSGEDAIRLQEQTREQLRSVFQNDRGADDLPSPAQINPPTTIPPVVGDPKTLAIVGYAPERGSGSVGGISPDELAESLPLLIGGSRVGNIEKIVTGSTLMDPFPDAWLAGRTGKREKDKFGELVRQLLRDKGMDDDRIETISFVAKELSGDVKEDFPKRLSYERKVATPEGKAELAAERQVLLDRKDEIPTHRPAGNYLFGKKTVGKPTGADNVVEPPPIYFLPKGKRGTADEISEEILSGDRTAVLRTARESDMGEISPYAWRQPAWMSSEASTLPGHTAADGVVRTIPAFDEPVTFNQLVKQIEDTDLTPHELGNRLGLSDDAIDRITPPVGIYAGTRLDDQVEAILREALNVTETDVQVGTTKRLRPAVKGETTRTPITTAEGEKVIKKDLVYGTIESVQDYGPTVDIAKHGEFLSFMANPDTEVWLTRVQKGVQKQKKLTAAERKILGTDAVRERYGRQVSRTYDPKTKRGRDEIYVPTDTPWEARNQEIVDKSDVVLAIWDGTRRLGRAKTGVDADGNWYVDTAQGRKIHPNKQSATNHVNNYKKTQQIDSTADLIDRTIRANKGLIIFNPQKGTIKWRPAGEGPPTHADLLMGPNRGPRFGRRPVVIDPVTGKPASRVRQTDPEIIVRTSDQADDGRDFRRLSQRDGGTIPGWFIEKYVPPVMRKIEISERAAAHRAGQRSPIELMYADFMIRESGKPLSEQAHAEIIRSLRTYSNDERISKVGRKFLNKDMETTRRVPSLDEGAERQATSPFEREKLGYSPFEDDRARVDNQEVSKVELDQLDERARLDVELQAGRDRGAAEGLDRRELSFWEDRAYIDRGGVEGDSPKTTSPRARDIKDMPEAEYLPGDIAQEVLAGNSSQAAERHWNWFAQLLRAEELHARKVGKPYPAVDPSQKIDPMLQRARALWFGTGKDDKKSFMNLVGAFDDDELSKLLVDYARGNRKTPFHASTTEFQAGRYKSLEITGRLSETIDDVSIPPRRVSPEGQVRRVVQELRQMGGIDPDNPVVLRATDEWRHSSNPRLHATTRKVGDSILIHFGKDARGYVQGSIPAGRHQLVENPAEAAQVLARAGFFKNTALGGISGDALGIDQMTRMVPIADQSVQQLIQTHRDLSYAIDFYRRRNGNVPQALQEMADQFYDRWRQYMPVNDTFLWGKENQAAVGLHLKGSEPGAPKRNRVAGEIDDHQLSILENPEIETPSYREIESMPAAERAWQWQQLGIDHYDQQRMLVLANLDSSSPLTGSYDPINTDPLGPAMNLVIVGKGRDARIGVLESPNVGIGKKSSRVRFYDEKIQGWKVEEVAKTDMELSIQPGDDMDLNHIRALNGETQINALPTSPFGTGVLDQRLGLEGISKRTAYRKKISEKIEKILTKNADKFDDKIEEITLGSMTKRDVDDLVDLYIRSIDSATYKNQDTFEQALNKLARKNKVDVNLEFMNEMKALAYDRLSRLHSPNIGSTSAEVLIQSKLGMLPNKRQTKLLEFAEAHGIKTKDRPLWQTVEEVLQNIDNNLIREVEDFQWGNILRSLWTDETGAVPLGLDLNRLPWLKPLIGKATGKFFPDHQVVIKDVRPPKDIGPMARVVGLPKTVADRHPTFQFLYRNAVRADTQAKREAQYLRRKIEDYWLPRDPDHAHLKTVQALWNRGFHSWGDVVENLEPDEFAKLPAQLKWQGKGTRSDLAFRDFFEDYSRTMLRVRKSLLRGHLLSGHKPITFDKENPAHTTLAYHDLLLSERIQAMGGEKAAHGKLLLAGKDDATGLWAARDPDEVTFFLDKVIEPEYRIWDDVDPEVRKRIQDSGYKWMGEEFEFWNNLGRNDPLPLAHEGRVEVKVHKTNARGEKIEVVEGYASNVPDALALIKLKIKEGDPRFVGPSIEEVVLNADQVVLTGNDFRYGTDVRYLERVSREMTLNGGLTPQQLAIVTGSTLPPKGSSVRMEGGKKSLVDDPYDRLGYLFRRAVQSEYKTSVQRAAYQAMVLDADFAKVFGSGRLFDDLPNHLPFSEMVRQARHQPTQSSNARMYFDHYLSRALGEASQVDHVLDRALARWSYVKSLPGKATEKLLTDNAVDLRWSNAAYYQPFRGRALASNILDLQAVMRLGFSPAAAAVNSSQWMINSVPLLGAENIKYAWGDLALFRKVSKDVFSKLEDQYGSDWYRIFKEGKGMIDIPELRDPEVVKALALFDILDEAGVTLAMPRSQRSTGWGMSMDEAPKRMLKKPTESVFEGKMGEAWDWASFSSLYMFNKAEKVNRILTAFAAARKANDIGITDTRGKVAFITDMIDRTQFTYTDLGLSPIMGNPVGKVLFQFKPFLANQLRYEANLIRKTVTAQPGQRIEAMKAFTEHFGTIGFLGGASSIMYSPVPFAAAVGISMFKNGQNAEGMISNALLHQFGGKGYLDEGTDRYNTPWWNPHTFFTHGALGLFGMDVSRRLSLSGPELVMSKLNDAISAGLGPHMGMYAHWALALADPDNPMPAPARVAAGAATIAGFPTLKGMGGIAAGAGTLAGLTAGGDTPMISGNRVNKTLATLASPVRDPGSTPSDIYGGALFQTKPGRRFWRNIQPTFARNLNLASDIITTGITWDLGLNPTYHSALSYSNGMRLMPGQEPLESSQVWDAINAILGVRPARQSIERAGETVLSQENDRMARLQDQYADLAAEAYFEGRPGDSMKIIVEANLKHGITISSSMINPRIQALRQTRFSKTLDEAIKPLQRRRDLKGTLK